MADFKTGDRAIFSKNFGLWTALNQEIELVTTPTLGGILTGYGGFKFVNKDGGYHSLNDILKGEWEGFGLYIPYSCVELISGQLEND